MRFAGSGRIGEACLLLGREYIGFDNDTEWIVKAEERLKAAAWDSVKQEDCLRLCTAKKAA